MVYAVGHQPTYRMKIFPTWNGTGVFMVLNVVPIKQHFFAHLAQLVRVDGLYPFGHWFKSSSEYNCLTIKS